MTNSKTDALTSNEVVERISEHSDADACQRTLDLLNDAATDIERLQEAIARCYLRLQCADVPREPWHWEVCTTLNNTGIPAKPSEQCPYCLHPVRIDGSILHAGGCAGLDTIKVTRLQYDTLTKAHGNETGEGHVAVIEQLTAERDFARRELDRACQETREALSREIAARRGQEEIAQWHEYANSVERAMRHARLQLPPRPSQKASEPRVSYNSNGDAYLVDPPAASEPEQR